MVALRLGTAVAAAVAAASANFCLEIASREEAERRRAWWAGIGGGAGGGGLCRDIDSGLLDASPTTTLRVEI